MFIVKSALEAFFITLVAIALISISFLWFRFLFSFVDPDNCYQSSPSGQVHTEI